MKDWNIIAGWEKPENTNRWFITWKYSEAHSPGVLQEGIVAGYIAGYSGGGTFEVEPFWSKIALKKDIAQWEVLDFCTEYDNKITFEDAEWTDDLESLASDAYDIMWLYNDEDVWADTDRVIYKEGSMPVTVKPNDMFYYTSSEFGEDMLEIARKWCEVTGLTAGPR